MPYAWGIGVEPPSYVSKGQAGEAGRRPHAARHASDIPGLFWVRCDLSLFPAPMHPANGHSNHVADAASMLQGLLAPGKWFMDKASAYYLSRPARVPSHYFLCHASNGASTCLWLAVAGPWTFV